MLCRGRDSEGILVTEMQTLYAGVCQSQENVCSAALAITKVPMPGTFSQAEERRAGQECLKGFQQDELLSR